MTFEILVLICTLGQSPQDCQPPTARSTYILGKEPSELACLRQAQMSEGRVSLAIGSDEYRKFMCLRTSR